MADEKLVEILKRSVPEWNRLRSGRMLREVDLRRANLHDLDLHGARLSAADLRTADLSGSNLHGADLSGSDLRDAYLVGANLRAATVSLATVVTSFHFRRQLFSRFSNLRWADLSETVLYEATFDQANLTNVDLSNSAVGRSVFRNVDLSGARGLESVHHAAPSILDEGTLKRSGCLPSSFVKACGIGDVVELSANPRWSNRFSTCFISYSTHDQRFAERVHADLGKNGVRCWFAPHDILPGRKLHEQIDEAIRTYDRLLLILSDASMASEWVKTEIANARQKELAQKRQVLFPISIVPYEQVKEWKAFDADTGKDSAREIREYFIPDFTGWDTDHARYKEAFDKLLKGLKAESGTTS